MSKIKITLHSINEKLQKLRQEIRDLRETMFKWGQQNMKEIDNIKQKLKAVEVDIGEYDKFISAHNLNQKLSKLNSQQNTNTTTKATSPNHEQMRETGSADNVQKLKGAEK